jgi:hypothetical protein
MNLTPHFTLEELTYSSTAVEKAIDNTPPPDIVDNLKVLAEGLEQVRAFLEGPLHINSGYRCPLLNQEVGGTVNSAHTQGFAADFVCPQFGTPDAIVRFIADSGLAYDQVIQEGTWVHISFAPTMRRSALLAHFTPGKPTTYTTYA